MFLTFAPSPRFCLCLARSRRTQHSDSTSLFLKCSVRLYLEQVGRECACNLHSYVVTKTDERQLFLKPNIWWLPKKKKKNVYPVCTLRFFRLDNWFVRELFKNNFKKKRTAYVFKSRARILRNAHRMIRSRSRYDSKFGKFHSSRAPPFQTFSFREARNFPKTHRKDKGCMSD